MALSHSAIAAAAAVDQARQWRRLMTMAEHGATPAGGVNRQALSAEDAAARRTMLDWAQELGLEPASDAIGNLYLRRPGTDPAAAPVMTGSHLDSQPMGGKFDGAYGVIAGVEALNALNEAGIATRRAVEVVAWTNEEGSRFQPGMMGSAVFTSHMALQDLLPMTDRDGETVGESLESFMATTPEVPIRSGSFPVAAYVEAHIEQGPRLEAAGKPIGVVSGVQGMRWFAIEVLGEAAHAGTTPHALRRDALKAAAQMVGALERLMADDSDRVRFTIGRFEVAPGSPNTVPARVFFTIDFRHPEAAVIEHLAGQIELVCQENARGCSVTVQRTSDSAPTTFDPTVVGTISQAAGQLGYEALELPSGAGHDAMYLADLCPTGMIFVPCAQGISHNEAESASPEDLAAGTRVLAATLAELANR